MSTYYGLACDECKQYVDFFTRQAWGYGNADPIAAFKFGCLHSGHNRSLRVINEHEDAWFEYEDVLYGDDATRRKFIDETAGMWPHTSDWQIAFCGDTTHEMESAWATRLLERAVGE